MWKINNYKFIYLCVLPIFFLISSTFSNLIVIVGSILFVFNSFKTNNFKWLNDKVFLILMLFYLYLLINHFFFSYDKDLSFSRSVGFIRYIIFVMAIKYFYWPKDKKIEYDLIKAWSIICVIVFLDTIFQFYTGFNIFGFKSLKMGAIQRLSSFLNDEYKIAGFILVFGIICFSFLMKQRLFGYIFIFLFSFSIALTGERANFYIFIITIFIFLILCRENFLKKSIYVFLLFLSFLITFNTKPLDKNLKYSFLKYRYIYFLDESYPTKDQGDNFFNFKKEDEEILKDEKNHNNLDFYLSKIQNINYYPHYYTAYHIFKDNKLFGTGLKTFRKICSEEKYTNKNINNFDEKKCSTHPHNFVLEFLSEIGLLGFFLIILFFISIINQNIPYFFLFHKNTIMASCFLILFLYFPILPRGSFFTSWNAGLFWLVVGINMGIIYNQDNINKKV